MTLTNKMLTDYYRCPSHLDVFAPPSVLPEERGYFRLGQDTVCYGRLSSGQTASSAVGDLHDALPNVSANGVGIRLPFDAGEVIENLRCERYAAGFHGDEQILKQAVLGAYYFARPLMPVSVRKGLQKVYLKGWDKIRFPAWPVDGTVERIHQKLMALSLKAKGLKEIPFIWFWPDGFPSCAIMTHDVETSAGRDYCSRLMDVDASFGLRSAFQIVPELRYKVPRSFLFLIRERGFEVNIHDLNHDGHLFDDRGRFLRRAERINDYAKRYGARGFRSAILYRNTDWFGAFEFSYDMSVPNVAHLDPQRGGCCTVMPYFIGKVLELPLTTTQDYTLFHILEDYSIELWKRQIRSIMEQNGLLSFVSHPDYLTSKRALATYVGLLEYLAHLRSRGQIWLTLPGEVDIWWRQRSRMSLECSGGTWRIEGEGSERARLAYASLDGDRLVYRVTKPQNQHQGVERNLYIAFKKP